MATKTEIIAELELLGIDHDPKERKEDLEDLLWSEDNGGPEGPELCLQCGRPADHKHIGV